MDRHKPSRTVRIPEKMARQLEKLAKERKMASLTEIVKWALSYYLDIYRVS